MVTSRPEHCRRRCRLRRRRALVSSCRNFRQESSHERRAAGSRPQRRVTRRRHRHSSRVRQDRSPRHHPSQRLSLPRHDTSLRIAGRDSDTLAAGRSRSARRRPPGRRDTGPDGRRSALSLKNYGTYRRFHPGRAVEGDDVADDAPVDESGGRPAELTALFVLTPPGQLALPKQ